MASRVPFALVAIALVACSSSDGSPTPPPCQGVPPESQEACLTDYYFRNYAPQPVSACPNFTPTSKRVADRREINFFLGSGTSDISARTEGQFLQRYYETYELTFFTRVPAAPAPLRYALSASNEDLERLPGQLGISLNQPLTSEQRAALDKAVGELVFRDLRAFVRSQSNPPRTSINIVVLGQIASPEIAAQFQGGVIAGLGLSPTLFRNIATDDPSKNLFELIGIGEDFTPTLFVGHDDVTRLAKSPDVIVAHELGHSMGLQHTKDPGDLMTQYGASRACLPGLTDAEIDTIKKTALMMDPGCAYSRLFEVRDSMVRGLLARRR